MVRNKRGQGLSTNSIVLIVLAVIVLAILALGFTVGWKSFAVWLPSDNVDDIANSCEVACTIMSEYDYCVKERELIADGLPGNEKSVMGTCSYFATTSEYESYGIQECGSITCS